VQITPRKTLARVVAVVVIGLIFVIIAADAQTKQNMPTEGRGPITTAARSNFKTNATFVKASAVLSSLTPTATAAGTPALTLTVSGTNMRPNAVILWNGVRQSTKFVSATQLTANISAAQIAAAGTAAISVSANGMQSNVLTFTVAQSYSSATPQPSPLQVTTTAVPSGTVGVAYQAGITAAGGTSPYRWSQAAGMLPVGLTLGGNGVVSGTPTTQGSYSFTAMVTDSGSPAQTASATFSISIAAPATSSPTTTPLSIVTTSLPSGTTGTAYSATLSGSGGTPGYTWGISSGSLPPGLTLAATSGQISGTPITGASYSFTVRLSDSGSPAQSASRSFTILVVASNSSNNTILFQNNFESCTPPSGAYGTVAISNTGNGGYAHSGNCSIKNTGGNLGGTTGYWPGLWSTATNEVWIRNWIMFDPAWIFGSNAAYTAGLGLHMQRFYTDPAGQEQIQHPVFLLDMNTDSNGNGIPRFGMWNGSSYIFYDTPGNVDGVSFVTPSTVGQWHCVELHLKQNTPGNADGLVEAYRDGIQIESRPNVQIEGGTMDYAFSNAALMNNISGTGGCGSSCPAWPNQDAWYLDDVVVSTQRYGCGNP
jgi:hypothetical protein